MRNTGAKPADVTVLLVGQDFSITTLWPAQATINRIASGDEKSADIAQIDPASPTASDERLVFIAVPGLGKAHTVFDNLEQEGLRDAAANDDATPEMAELRSGFDEPELHDAGRGSANRRASRRDVDRYQALHDRDGQIAAAWAAEESAPSGPAPARSAKTGFAAKGGGIGFGEAPEKPMGSGRG